MNPSTPTLRSGPGGAEDRRLSALAVGVAIGSGMTVVSRSMPISRSRRRSWPPAD
jgi:hypothetical protein